MPDFIALRRRPRTESAGLAALSFEDRRSEIAKAAPQSERIDALKGIGLKEIKQEGMETAEEYPEPPRDCFTRLGYVGAYVINATDEETAQEAMDVLESDYLIMPDIELGLPQTTIASSYRRRPYKQPTWPDCSGVKLAHRNDITGKGVLVGVLDTGCDADHLELRDKYVDFRYVPLHPSRGTLRACRGFDVDGHGTHVCGIIAGKNVGVAPDVDLMVASVIESETMKTSLRRIFTALDWMLSQFAREENLSKSIIISMSLGFRTEWIGDSESNAVFEGMQQLLNTLVTDFDVLPIVAIGNDGPGVMRAPGYYRETLSVGAVDFKQQVARFSGGGISPLTNEPEPNLVGYGVDVLSSLERSIDNRSLYARMNGTSMATPYVAGIAALYASANPHLQGAALRQHIIDEVIPLDAPAERAGVGLARFA